MARRDDSRAYVQFTGGSDEERQKIQSALDAQYNGDTMIGHIEAAFRWRGPDWQLLSATSHPTAIGTGPNIPPVPAPHDCSAEVLEILRAAGVKAGR